LDSGAAAHHGQDLDRIPVLNRGVQPAQEDAVPAVDQDGLQIAGVGHILPLKDTPQELLQPDRPFDPETHFRGPGQPAGLPVELDGDHGPQTA
jgi:hypothetical protein